MLCGDMFMSREEALPAINAVKDALTLEDS